MKTTLLLTTALLSASTGAFAASPMPVATPHPVISTIRTVTPVIVHPIAMPSKAVIVTAHVSSVVATPARKVFAPLATHITATVANTAHKVTVSTPTHALAALVAPKLVGKIGLITPVKKDGIVPKPSPKDGTNSNLDQLKTVQKDEGTVSADQRKLAADQNAAEKAMLNVGNQAPGQTPSDEVGGYVNALNAVAADKAKLATDSNVLAVDKSILGVKLGTLGSASAPPPAPALRGVLVPNGPISATQKTVLTAEVAVQESKDSAAASKASKAMGTAENAQTAAMDKVANDLANNNLVTFKQDMKDLATANQKLHQADQAVASAYSALSADFANVNRLKADPVK